MAKKKISKAKSPTFEAALKELEEIVAKLESGQLGLAESLQEYEHGVKHLKSCYEQLTSAERRIELVSNVDASGQPRTEAFDDEASASIDKKWADDTGADDPGAGRSRRRSVKKGVSKTKRRTSSDVDDSSSLF